MKKLFIIPLLGIVSFSLVSCLEMGKGGNIEEATVPGVINYNIKAMALTMLTAYGEFATPSLSSTDLTMGDCVLAHFTLDWDNQPQNEPPYLATNISYITVSQRAAEIQSLFDEKEPVVPATDLLPIQQLTPQSYSPILNGTVFFIFSHSASAKQEMDYIMIAKPGEASGDPATIYITGKKKNKPDESISVIETIYAFDMLNTIEELGTVTTVSESTVEHRVKQLKVKIKYCTGIDSDNIPNYQDYNGGNPVTLSVYTN